MFITKKVFDPSLMGKAVYINGEDASGGLWDNVFLVSRVDADIIHLITNTGIALKFHMDNFESGILKMDVWEPGNLFPLPFEPENPEPEPIEMIGPEPKQRKSGFKRTPSDRTIQRRSFAQMEQDARLVSSIMQRNGGEMKLQDITAAVNGAGGDWYDKSASGHMIKVMERVPAIKKVGFGLYKYEQ
jgi:hypothetical protein